MPMWPDWNLATGACKCYVVNEGMATRSDECTKH